VLALGLLARTNLKPAPIRSLAFRVLGIRAATATLDVPIFGSIEHPSQTRGDEPSSDEP
jgi:hypothetical protein